MYIILVNAVKQPSKSHGWQLLPYHENITILSAGLVQVFMEPHYDSSNYMATWRGLLAVSIPTRVTDMQVRHNFSARHNQLPAKPPLSPVNPAHVFMAELAICKLQNSIMAE